jgi:hypothetical protein
MPYTFLHPAFVLPLQKRFPRLLDTQALIMGSIAPDLDIIFRFSETRYHLFSYSPLNIFGLILPIAVVLSIYMRLVMIPIFSSGSLKWSFSSIAQTFKRIPAIILSALLAILMHLLLDEITHLDDVIGKAKYWAYDLGREPDDYQDIYRFFMYAPAVLASAIGGLLTLYLLWVNRAFLREWTSYFRAHVFEWMRIGVLLAVAFAMMKQIKAGVDEVLPLDSYIISITCGLTASFLLVAPFYYLEHRFLKQILSKIPDAPGFWHALMPAVAAFYLLGLPQKEYLRIFAAKGLYLMLMAGLALMLVHMAVQRFQNQREPASYFTGLSLFIYLFLAMIWPGMSWLKLLLLIQWVVLLILHLFTMRQKAKQYVIFLASGPLLFVVAYYFSNKGFGPAAFGLLVLGGLVANRWWAFDRETKWNGLYIFLEIALIVILLLSKDSAASLVFFLGLACTFLRKWGLDEAVWRRHFQVLYEFWLPFTAVAFIALEYSIAYALLSACALFLFFPDTLIRTWRYYRAPQMIMG